jgi:hypothetical protein
LPAGVRASAPEVLERGYHQMYNQEFDRAHASFAEFQQLQPGDPMGPVSDAAAYLFSEFDRLHILQSEFFTDDSSFLGRQERLAPDPAAARAFQEALARARAQASATLKRASKDQNALFAMVLATGLESDYLSLIAKQNFAALSKAKQARRDAQQLLNMYPDCYDAYVAIGVENYLLSLKPLAVRWLLRLGGAQTNKQLGISRVRIVAEKGRLLRPFARLLLAVAALRDEDLTTARRILTELAAQYPQNTLFRRELQRLS